MSNLLKREPDSRTPCARRTRNISCSVLLLACLVGAACAQAQKEEEIARLSQVLGWKEGQTFADVGAGLGEFGIAAAAKVGDTGKVYLTELDEDKRKALESDIKGRGLKNVLVLQAAEKQTNLPDSCCDGILLRRVYHHLTAPAEMDASLLRSLKPGGLLAVVDFPPRKWLSATDPVKGVPANRGGHGIPRKVLVEELTAAGLKVEKVLNDWPDDNYCVIFRKPAA